MRTIEEILNDVEIGSIVKSFVDKRVTQGIQTALSKRLDTSTLTARLYRLEGATKKLERQNAIKFHAFKKATEKGVDYCLIENETFADEASAEKRINALVEFAKQRAAKDLNSNILAHAFQPGTGNPKESRPKTFNDYVSDFSIEK